NRPDIGPRLEEMSRKRVAQRVAARRLGEPGGPHRLLEGPLHHRLVKMMAPPLAGAGIIVRATRWKYPLPPPLTSRLGVLRPQRPRQLHPARSLRHIALVPSAHPGEMPQQGTLEALGQHRHTVAVTLSGPHPDPVRRDTAVLRPQAQRLEQPH